ncbi:MAG TPA: hypothetical protein V6D08_07675 [Candidatus Obscuribacterales bacterium]
MILRYAVLAMWALLAALFIYLAIANPQPLTLTIFGSQLQTPLSLILLAPLAASLLAAVSTELVRAPRVASDRRKLEWAAQDAKLLAEVKSDREKQLEAKIATLETALKQALAKNK